MKIESSLPEATLRVAMNGERQRLRQNVYILFVGLTDQEVSPILAMLQQIRLTPRSKNIHNSRQFARALSERSWDIVISQQTAKEITAKNVQQMLQRLDKDIPIIQIVANNTRQANILGSRDGMAAVASLAESELLLLQIHQQLKHLDNRRQIRRLEAQLAEAERNNQLLADSSRSAIIFLNLVMAPIYSNLACHELFGIDDSQILQQHGLLSFIAPDDHSGFNELLASLQHQAGEGSSIELRARHAKGNYFKVQVDAQHSRFNNQDCIQLIIRADSQAEAEKLENIDPVTRLHDRQYLLNKLETATQRALLGGADAHLLYIRLDNYRQLHKALKEQGSNIMMTRLATLFKDKFNQPHVCARLEDDAFAIVYQDSNLDKTMRIAELMRISMIREGKNIADSKINLNCSVGISGINDNAPHYLELIERAAEASRDASLTDSGISLYQTADTEDDASLDDAVDLLREAMVVDSFALHFQPIVNLRATKGVGNYEVLLRLQDDNNSEASSPGQFFASLDSAASSVKLDQWVIEHSLDKLRQQTSDEQPSRLFLNLTLSSIQSPQMLSWIRQTLKKSAVAGKLIGFQLSETDIQADKNAAIKFIQGVRKLGCKTCIKHYHLTEQSEALCKEIRPDLVKLDQSYLQSIEKQGKTSPEFSRHIKQLNSGKIACIAPMVEDTRLLSRLWQAGVPFIQGYYLQPPKPEMSYDFFEE